jgi:polyisoprenoid-binding protein YceI
MSTAVPVTDPSTAETWVVDPSHSEVTFQVRHLITKLTGKFDQFDGTAILDRSNPGNSSVEFRIKAASINTGNADRDAHLRTGDFFNAEENPEITFKSSSVRPTGGDDYEVTGTLTMRGVSKEITIPVEFGGFAADPWGNQKAGFETTVKVNRKDYGINWNAALETGGFLVGDEVKITISLQLAAKK